MLGERGETGHHGSTMSKEQRNPSDKKKYIDSGIQADMHETVSVEGQEWGHLQCLLHILVFIFKQTKDLRFSRVQPIHVLVGLIHCCRGDNESLPNGKTKESLMSNLISGQNISNS